MPKRAKGNKIIVIITIMLIILLLCYSYMISLIGRVDVINSTNVEIEIPDLGKPDEIIVTAPSNENNNNGNNSSNNNNYNTNTSYTNTTSNTNTSNNVNNINENNNVIGGNQENNTVNETPNNNEVDSGNEVEEGTGFSVTDENQTWEDISKLRIFENPVYNMREKIAPGSTNSYAFNLVNNNEFNVKCNLSFIEENSHNINMKYRLKQDNNYICGDNGIWVTYDELKAEAVLLNTKQSIPYILEWKWFSDEKDTEIGETGNVTYGLSIKVYVEEII